jgi:NAD(P)-dependent dehydrogenase (short-subunit alcohol dehydrogenase family)
VQLAGKRAIVTGGASGIGAATVRAYAREGAAVVSLDVDVAGGKAVVDAIAGDCAIKPVFRCCDVSDRAAVFSAVAESVGLLGGLDALVCAAAIESHAEPEDITEEELDRYFNINIKGTIFPNQAAFPALRDSSGCIINFSSSAGITGGASFAHYSATKGAVLAWTRAIAQAWMRYQLRANAVVPAIWTPMYDRRRTRFASDAEREEHDARRARTMLGGRLGDPDTDLAPVMTFLASDGARFITGQTIPVNGGSLIVT